MVLLRPFFQYPFRFVPIREAGEAGVSVKSGEWLSFLSPKLNETVLSTWFTP